MIYLYKRSLSKPLVSKLSTRLICASCLRLVTVEGISNWEQTNTAGKWDTCQDIHWEATLGFRSVLSLPPKTLPHIHKPSPLLAIAVVLYTRYIYPRIPSHTATRCYCTTYPEGPYHKVKREKVSWSLPCCSCLHYCTPCWAACLAFNPPIALPPNPYNPSFAHQPTHSAGIYQEEIHGRSEARVPSIHLTLRRVRSWQKLPGQRLGFGTGRNG